MDLQFFISVNVMAFSALAISIAALQRAPGTESWALANGAVICAGFAALHWLPAWAGWAVLAVFVPLIVAPIVLSQLAIRASNGGNTARAALLSTVIACLHPAPHFLAAARRARAVASDDRDGTDKALSALAMSSPAAEQPACRALIASRRQDWAGVLAVAAENPARVLDFKSLEIRAYGELGETDAMLAAYRILRPRLDAAQGAAADLVVMAFTGRETAVEALLTGRLKSVEPDAQGYWRAAARLARVPDDAEARASLARIATTAARSVTRKAAAARLVASPAAPLSLSGSAEAAAVEQQVLHARSARRFAVSKAPVSLALLSSYLVMFALEAYQGGTENIETLLDLGALWPPLVIDRGEWWRLLTAAFLHLGALHLVANSSLLVVLGPMTERAIGSLRFLAVYLAGALVSSSAVLALMEFGSSGEGILVGASGALFSIFGLEAARRLKSWFRSRDVGDRRQIALLAIILALQFGIDLSIPEVSFTAHISGFLTGLVIGLLLPARSRPA